MEYFLEASATYSPCQRYRYTLMRRWAEGLARIAFVMLNPSTATAEISDPTVTRCIRFAQRWGYGELVVINAFALRSTDPKELYRVDDPVGPENDAAIAEWCAGVDVVVAWGNHGRLLNRGEQVMAMLRPCAARIDCLGVTKEGQPKHPLYLSNAQMRKPYLSLALFAGNQEDVANAAIH